MEEVISRIVITGADGKTQTLDLGKKMPFEINEDVLIVHGTTVQAPEAPAIIHGRDDEGLVRSHGFVITKHEKGKRIEFKDPNTGNCFVAKLGINSVEPISWYGEPLDVNHLHDPDTAEIQKKRDFVKNHGMIIVPQYCLSYDGKNLRAVAGRRPFVNKNWQDSYKLFSKMKLPRGVSISMIAGFELDQSLQHIIDTTETIRDDITKDCRIFGGYVANEVYETGIKGTPCIDRVYNQTGLVRFWTQEMYKDDCRVLRCGSCARYSRCSRAASRGSYDPNFSDRFCSATATLSW